ncbi:hypothetical protein ABDK96_09025 [Citricoccus nitrophenolicus]|uniref:Uncharacterized protein n=1 Tax=Citricoccus nitrophenolicus TaxID=863575 RepID=A0ABV0II32_9MICC|nr:hypothetical protein [Citricoccus sp. I39-566]NUL46938.1 hypothetical protein [Cellulosimicrobium funkei]WMY77958.1 hypothetical protein RE421_14200 [Citricoccus sp. I39-566]
MVSYNIVTDECQRVLNLVSEELFAIRTDYQHVEDDIEDLRGYVCGSTERVDQTASQNDLDAALTAYFTEVDAFFEDLRQDLGTSYLAMQDVLNYFVSGDAEMKHQANAPTVEFPYELTTSGEGDAPPAYDTREMWEGNQHAVELGEGTYGAYDTAYINHTAAKGAHGG